MVPNNGTILLSKASDFREKSNYRWRTINSPNTLNIFGKIQNIMPYNNPYFGKNLRPFWIIDCIFTIICRITMYGCLSDFCLSFFRIIVIFDEYTITYLSYVYFKRLYRKPWPLPFTYTGIPIKLTSSYVTTS